MNAWHVINETVVIIVVALIAFVVLIALIRRTAPKVAGTTQGWWPDPFGRHELRYCDGRKWTEYVFDQGVSSVSPAIPVPSPQAGQE